MEWLWLFLLAVVAYLVGAVPSGLIMGRLLGRDILQMGSGKTGTANTLSSLGRGAAAAVFSLDLLKGIAVVLLARLFVWPGEAWHGLATGLAGALAIVGHNRSVWVRLFAGSWGGGRGIMVAVGALLIVHPLIILGAVVAGAATLVITRFVVVATLAAVGAGLVTAALLAFAGWISPWMLLGCLAWGLLVAAGFWDSIGRLLKREEKRV